MAVTKKQRSEMEKVIYEVFSALDPTGDNTQYYKKLFSSMSDTQFDSYFKELFKNEDAYLPLNIVDYEKSLKMEHVEKAAKVIDVPLYEYLFIPNILANGEVIVTKYKVPVGYAHIKRVQQLVMKKNTTSTEIGSRSAITGQVVGKDKNARDSDSENFALVTLGANETLKELLGPKADDMVMKSEMYADIAKKGYTTLDSLTNNVDNKTTLNTLDVFLIGMGIKSDLITKGLVLRNSLGD